MVGIEWDPPHTSTATADATLIQEELLRLLEGQKCEHAQLTRDAATGLEKVNVNAGYPYGELLAQNLLQALRETEAAQSDNHQTVQAQGGFCCEMKKPPNLALGAVFYMPAALLEQVRDSLPRPGR